MTGTAAATAKAKTKARRITILIAIAPASLSRVIDHLFKEHTDFHIVGRLGDRKRLAAAIAILAPDLIVANEKFLGRGPRQVIVEVKRRSPHSQLILVRSVEGYSPGTARHGADASLTEETVVRRLLTTARRLSSPRRG